MHLYTLEIAGEIFMFAFLSISMIILLAVISPGPDFIIVTRNALRYSQRAGVMTALGMAISTLFHSTYCILGLSLIISQSILLFNLIKGAGAAYLIYLGIKGLMEKPSSDEKMQVSKARKEITAWKAFSQGLICNISNPKTICFFLALFTTIINPSTSLFKKIGFSIEIAFIHLAWFSSVAMLFAHPKLKHFLGKFQFYITKVFGAILIAFGIKIATLIEVKGLHSE